MCLSQLPLALQVRPLALACPHPNRRKCGERREQPCFQASDSHHSSSKAAVPHMKPRSSIINTASINADAPSPQLLAYATTKGAIQNFTAGLAQMLAEKGIRANCVAPGPIWTPLIPSTMPPEKVKHFGM
jgi:NAD(P)-dependent dehydrogenase (short-subunit alcohol dehydrogenase family)